MPSNLGQSDSERSLENLLQRGAYVEAERQCEQMLKGEGSSSQVWMTLGLLKFQRNAILEAEQAFRAALAMEPANYEAWNNLSAALIKQERFDEAATCANSAISLGNQTAAPWLNLGQIRFHQGDLEGASTNFRRATEIAPENATAWVNLGASDQELGLVDEAVIAYRKAISLRPDYAHAYMSLGRALEELGQFDESAACYRFALTLDPTTENAHWHLSALALRRGDFQTAWLESLHGNEKWVAATWVAARIFHEPRWQGQSFINQRLLIHADQGLGDAIQLVRYVPFAKSLGGTVILECQRPLQELFRNAEGVDHLIGTGEPCPPFDWHCRLSQLPVLFSANVEQIPNRVPYLSAKPSLVEDWSRKLAALCGVRIAVNWHGVRNVQRGRHIPVKYFADLGSLAGLSLISIQKLDNSEPNKGESSTGDNEATGSIHLVENLDETNGAFMDTAAIMKTVDLVITSDTSVAHLAGALAVPVWVVLPFVADCRWFLDRSDSPWYPTMRLFREKTRGDWQGVFAEVRTALESLIANHSPRLG